MDMTFRTALAVSALAHSLVFAPLYKAVMPKTDIKDEKPIVVDYVVIRDLPRVEDAKDPELKPPETPRIELPKNVEMKPSPQSPKAAEARIKSTHDYINYYQAIREKIRQALKSNYSGYYKNGEVALVFMLNRDGSLVSVGVVKLAKSTDDRRLVDIAVLSVREASPFPPFPKALAVPQMSFNLTVSFRRK